eukprot:8803027-Pyramimonas_sp.AAC.1
MAPTQICPTRGTCSSLPCAFAYSQSSLGVASSRALCSATCPPTSACRTGLGCRPKKKHTTPSFFGNRAAGPARLARSVARGPSAEAP